MSYDDDDDYLDYEDPEAVYNALRDQIKKVGKASEKRDDQLAASFTRVAEAVEKLAKEVASLREELNPQPLDKKTLPAPASKPQTGATP